MDSFFLNFDWFTYVILPLLIFLARIVDVTLDTLRIVFVSKGDKYLGKEKSPSEDAEELEIASS